MEKTPHYKPNRQKQAFAKRLRQTMSDEEALLWTELRAFRKHGYSVKRQAAIGPYVADFLCRKAKIVIEVDGSQHDLPEQTEHDQKRNRWMENRGYLVLRYSTGEIRKDLDNIVDSINHFIRARLE